MDDIKIIVVLNIVLVMLQITREALGFMRDSRMIKRTTTKKKTGANKPLPLRG